MGKLSNPNSREILEEMFKLRKTIGANGIGPSSIGN